MSWMEPVTCLLFHSNKRLSCRDRPLIKTNFLLVEINQTFCFHDMIQHCYQFLLLFVCCFCLIYLNIFISQLERYSIHLIMSMSVKTIKVFVCLSEVVLKRKHDLLVWAISGILKFQRQWWKFVKCWQSCKDYTFLCDPILLVHMKALKKRYRGCFQCASSFKRRNCCEKKMSRQSHKKLRNLHWKKSRASNVAQGSIN